MIKYFLLSVSLLSSFSFAGVIPERTRIIYDSKSSSQSYMMMNTNKYPVIVQFWVDNGDPNKEPEKTPSPFVVTPVMARMDPSRLNSIKVIYSGGDKKLPEDKESLFYLNIFEIPPKSTSPDSQNEILLSMLTQIKLIYRPDRLKLKEGELTARLKPLKFSAVKSSDNLVSLKVYNPTPYIVSFSSFTLTGQDNGKSVSFRPADNTDLTVLPQSDKTFPIETGKSHFVLQGLDYWLVDDMGKFIQMRRNLSYSG